MARPLTPGAERALSTAQLGAQSGIRELLALHEAKVMSRMIAKYRSAKGLSPEDAKLGVGIIAELRSLAGDVERGIERGADTGFNLTR